MTKIIVTIKNKNETRKVRFFEEERNLSKIIKEIPTKINLIAGENIIGIGIAII